MTLASLQASIDEFQKVLEENLGSQNPDHMLIIIALLACFMKANVLLRECKSFKEQIPIFDLMKTLSPYIEGKKMEINQLLAPKEQDQSFLVAMALFEDQKTIFHRALDEANKKL